MGGKKITEKTVEDMVERIAGGATYIRSPDVPKFVTRKAAPKASEKASDSKKKTKTEL